MQGEGCAAKKQEAHSDLPPSPPEFLGPAGREEIELREEMEREKKHMPVTPPRGAADSLYLNFMPDVVGC